MRLHASAWQTRPEPLYGYMQNVSAPLTPAAQNHRRSSPFTRNNISSRKSAEHYWNRDYFEGKLERPLKDYLFLVCGPGPMMEAFRDFLTDAGVPRTQIGMEDFDIR